MPYTYHTDNDREKMLERIGVETEEALFAQIPEKFYLRDLLPIATGKSEPETLREFCTLADKNAPASAAVSFLGGGIYDHTVPSAVRNLSSRPEFATAYTPYQPEVSQGTLQVIFEFQTHISRLTGMDVANASMYDAASALAEASLMASKITRRSRVVYPANLNPRYLAVVRRYLAGQHVELSEVPLDDVLGTIDVDALNAALGDDVAAVIVQTPNYFGALERPWEFEGRVHETGALLVVAVDPISLGAFREPGSYGADIVVGEGQSLGNDISFGGPLLGFIGCRKSFIRQMPGRIVSATKDADGKDGFVLTLQTREQHIRREKATSNICTNQGLLATRATIYLSLLGEAGFTDLARSCHALAQRLADKIAAIPRCELRFDGPFFREFVVTCPGDAADVVSAARGAGLLAGVPLSKYFGPRWRRELLVAVTDKHNDSDLDLLCAMLKQTAGAATRG